MMKNQHFNILDLSDAEFVSFLYSERDRENSLSQYQGWNNWALAGAIITVLCVLYSAIKDATQINWPQVVYYSTGIVAFFLAYHTWLYLFRRYRGHDKTKVRFLKERTPWLESGLSIIVSISAIFLIPLYDDLSSVFWVWVIILVFQIIVVAVAVIYRDTLIPGYYSRPYFPHLCLNNIYSGLSGGLFCLVWLQSFKKASWAIFTPDFEVGICIGTSVVLLYALIGVNVENRVVRWFDKIIDDYLYVGATREETYRAILRNRMGYGVLEACEKDLLKVKAASMTCEQKEKKLEAIAEVIKSGNYIEHNLVEYLKYSRDTMAFLVKSLKQSDVLITRLDEIVRIAPDLHQVTEFKVIFDTNKELYKKMEEVRGRVGEISSLVQKEMDKYYCQKSNALCFKVDCNHRDDIYDKKYSRKMRR